MAFDTDYGTCSYCGAKKVKNPKTNKIFCSEKCWLKKGGLDTSPQAPQAPSASTELLTEIRDLLRSIDKKILLRDPESGEIIPF